MPSRNHGDRLNLVGFPLLTNLEPSNILDGGPFAIGNERSGRIPFSLVFADRRYQEKLNLSRIFRGTVEKNPNCHFDSQQLELIEDCSMVRKVVAGLLALALFSGCGGTSGPALYEVRGKLSWDDGKPAPNVVVTFAPIEKGVPTSAARTNDAGDFVLTTTSGQLGAGLGKYKVILAASKPAAAQASPTETMAAAYKNPGARGPRVDDAGGIPAEYTSADKSPIEIEVTGKKTDLSITVVRGAPS